MGCPDPARWRPDDRWVTRTGAGPGIARFVVVGAPKDTWCHPATGLRTAVRQRGRGTGGQEGRGRATGTSAWPTPSAPVHAVDVPMGLFFGAHRYIHRADRGR